MTGLTTSGRVIIGVFFVLAGISKIMDYAAVGETMAGVGLLPALLPLVIALEIGGGAVVMVGRPVRYVWGVALVLAAFTLLTNFYFHRFWELDGVMHRLELSLFFKNLAIAGALLMVAGVSYRSARP